MTRSRHHRNMMERIRLVCKIVQEHYEPGDQSKSYYQVWKTWVNPVYPMCYRTLLRYISTPLPKEKPSDDPTQLSLFDDLDNN